MAIVHVNASWFHVSERGRFGGMFGAMISMGLFFAFDVSTRVLSLAAGTGPGGIDATPVSGACTAQAATREAAIDATSQAARRQQAMGTTYRPA